MTKPTETLVEFHTLLEPYKLLHLRFVPFLEAACRTGRLAAQVNIWLSHRLAQTALVRRTT